MGSVPKKDYLSRYRDSHYKWPHDRLSFMMGIYILFRRDLHTTRIAKFMGPTWGPSGSCRSQMGPMLASWTLLSGYCCLKKDPWLQYCPSCWLQMFWSSVSRKRWCLTPVYSATSRRCGQAIWATGLVWRWSVSSWYSYLYRRSGSLSPCPTNIYASIRYGNSISG